MHQWASNNNNQVEMKWNYLKIFKISFPFMHFKFVVSLNFGHISMGFTLCTNEWINEQRMMCSQCVFIYFYAQCSKYKSIYAMRIENLSSISITSEHFTSLELKLKTRSRVYSNVEFSCASISHNKTANTHQPVECTAEFKPILRAVLSVWCVFEINSKQAHQRHH